MNDLFSAITNNFCFRGVAGTVAAPAMQEVCEPAGRIFVYCNKAFVDHAVLLG